MMKSFLRISKLIFVLVLFTIFVILFGEPAVKRYLDDSVVIRQTEEQSKTLLDAPAVTICVDQSRSWKKLNTSIERSGIKDYIKVRKVNDILRWITENVYNYSEII
jgi:hypothetical protein